MPVLDAQATAVLDVGKTNVKLVVFSGGEPVWQRSMPNRVLPGPPYPHADAEAIWAFALVALREAAGLYPIDTVVVTTHGATVALVDDRELVLPIPDYEFAGFDEVADEYRALRPGFSETGTPDLPQGLNWGRQLFYLQQRHSRTFRHASAILMYPQYWTWRLTGVLRSEVTSLGCHGDGWNPAAGRPSTLADQLGWSSLYPALAPAWKAAGGPTPEVQTATGLGADVRVLTGIHDSNASLLPHLLALEPPFTVISSGTWAVIMAVGIAADGLDPARDTLVNVDALGRPVPTARFMGGREYAALLDGHEPQADLDDVGAVLASGAMALPGFAAQGGPYHDRQGRIVGHLPGRPGARAALASLYCALMTDDQLDTLGAIGGPLLVEGSFAANPAYCGVLAALRPDQPVWTRRDTAGTAFGAALLADWPRSPPVQPPSRARPVGFAKALHQYRQRWREGVASDMRSDRQGDCSDHRS